MELLKAIGRMNKLDSDISSLDKWFSNLQVNEKPVTGREWLKLKRAIDNVIGDLAEERNELEEKVVIAVEGIEIECK